MHGQLKLTDTAAKHGTPFTGASCSRELPSLSRKIDEWFAEYGHGHTVVGRKPNETSIILSSNDYLALAKDARIVKAQIEALNGAGNTLFMSSVFAQYLEAQREFEEAMARFLGAEDTVLCQSGWAANDGLLQTIASRDTPVYVDHYAHASLWHGIQSAGAKPRVFRHNDPESLGGMLRRFGAGIVVVDAVYSTNGDICPLAKMVALCEESGSMIVVDESHSVGLWGDQGEGMVASLGLSDRVHFRTFSLSKAFVGRGGIVAGTARALRYFRYVSRPAIFSSAVLPYESAGFMKTLEIIKQENWRRAAIRESTSYMRRRLADVGFEVGDSISPIIALVGGLEQRTSSLRDALEAQDVFGAVFCAPATPKNASLVRLSLNSQMSRDELDRVVDVCAMVREQVCKPLFSSLRR